MLGSQNDKRQSPGRCPPCQTSQCLVTVDANMALSHTAGGPAHCIGGCRRAHNSVVRLGGGCADAERSQEYQRDAKSHGHSHHAVAAETPARAFRISCSGEKVAAQQPYTSTIQGIMGEAATIRAVFFFCHHAILSPTEHLAGSISVVIPGKKRRPSRSTSACHVDSGSG